jgi:hypothetical protein
MTETEECKPILVRPPADLRKRLESEAQKQNRSMSNLIVVMLTKVFYAIDTKRER